MEEKLEHIFSLVNDWLKFAEAKNAVLLTLQGAGVLAILSVLTNGESIPNYLTYYLICAIFFLILSILTCLLSFLPKTKIPWDIHFSNLQGSIENSDNLIFYGHILKYTPNEYISALLTRYSLTSTNSQFEKDLAEQIVINSQITYRKYELFRKALWLSISAILTPAIALLLWLIFS